MMKIACFMCLIAIATVPAYSQDNDAQSFEIDAVLNEVQKGLSDAQAKLGDGKLPSLKAVTLTMQTEFKKSRGGVFKLFVFSFGSSWERSRSNELVLKLEPPKAIREEEVSQAVALSDQLVDAILSAAKGVDEARLRKPPLLLANLTAEFKFVVASSTKASINFEIVPVSLELKGDMSKKAVHSVKVEFENPK